MATGMETEMIQGCRFGARKLYYDTPAICTRVRIGDCRILAGHNL